LIGKALPAPIGSGAIPISHLAKLPLVLPLLPFGSRQILEELAAEQGVLLQPVVEVDSPSIQKLLVLHHGLFSVFSRLVCQEELRRGLLHATQIVPAPKRSFYIASRAGRDLSSATRLIYHLLRRVGQKLNESTA
jgi:DNA-binding transcriptional LysR family regulator